MTLTNSVIYMWIILGLALLFIITLFIISMINAWMRVHNLRKSARFGTDRMAYIKHLRLHYVEFGEGRPLIFLPDVLGDYRTWNLLLPILSQKYRCLCVDYVGCGGSDKPRTFEYKLDNLARLVLDFMDEIRLDVANFVGVGLGGTLVFHLAGHYPVSVGRSVTIGSFINLNTNSIRSYEQALNLIHTPVVGNLAYLFLKNGMLGRHSARQIYGPHWQQMSAIEKRNFQNDLSLTMHHTQQENLIEIYDVWLRHRSLSKAITRIDVPILQLWGIQSRFPPSIHPTIERLKQYPKVTQWLIQESIHELHWQHPRWIAQVVQHFINEEDVFNEPGSSGGLWQVKVT